MDYQLGPGPLQVDQNTIDEKIKGDIGIVENGDVATHAIPSGYYVIWKGDLYVAKTDISSGTTLSTSNLTAKPNGLGADVAGLASNIANLSADSVISDCNAITVTGVYKAINSTTNTPAASSHYVIYHTQYDSTIEATQLAIKTGSNETFTRTKTGGEWTSWSKLALNSDLAKVSLFHQYIKETKTSAGNVTFEPDDNRYTALVFIVANDANYRSGVFAVLCKKSVIATATKLAVGNDSANPVSVDWSTGTITVALNPWSSAIVLTTAIMS